MAFVAAGSRRSGQNADHCGYVHKFRLEASEAVELETRMADLKPATRISRVFVGFTALIFIFTLGVLLALVIST